MTTFALNMGFLRLRKLYMKFPMELCPVDHTILAIFPQQKGNQNISLKKKKNYAFIWGKSKTPLN